MCGRFTLRTNPTSVALEFNAELPLFKPRFNICPTQQVTAIRMNDGNAERITTTVLPLDNSPVQVASDRQARSSPLWVDFDLADSFFTDSRRKSCNKTACAGK
jgi:putative SOS response-associated peptidase YedK